MKKSFSAKFRRFLFVKVKFFRITYNFLYIFFFLLFFFIKYKIRPKGDQLEQCFFLRVGTDIFFYMQPERSEPSGRIADKTKIAVNWKKTVCKLCGAHILCRRIPRRYQNKSVGKGGKGKWRAWRE